MEVKDTVMSDVRMMELGKGVARAEADHKIANEQAEISFKAGQQVGFEIGLEQGEAEGIRKVVEWIESHIIELTDTPSLGFARDAIRKDWQLFKKSNGL